MAAGAVALVPAAVALGAASFSDRTGDDNAAPDITSVSVEPAEGVFRIRAVVANFRALPEASWLNLWFDLDGDDRTGDAAGDDALVRFTADGRITFQRWDGSRFQEAVADGLDGQFEEGVLTVVVPAGALGALSSPGLLVVSARAQTVGREQLVASDFAPDRERLRFGSTGAAITDPEGDHDAAPDIAGVRVSDARSGWIRFAIETPNRSVLPERSAVVLSLDTDGRLSTGDAGAEATISFFGGEVLLERWSRTSRSWTVKPSPVRLRAHSGAGVVTIDVHRGELGSPKRFGFRLVSAELNPADGSLLALDFAPDAGVFWRYGLANAPALRLIAGRTTGTPAPPRAREAFTIRTPVRRSDTNRAITSGTVACDVRSGAERVQAVGSVRAGGGQCALVVPPGATVISGSMTVRSAGASVTARFRFAVG